jgi:chaperonin GroEL
MKKDNYITGKEAREKMFAGIKKVANVVGGTMGTGGYNGLVEAIENPGHLLTNDGITLAQNMYLADPVEEMGRKVLLEAISRANKASGDGSSTTCVLTSAIIEEGLKHLEDNSPMDIKKSLEECLPLIEESINSQKRDITVNEVKQVATISAEDEGIGQTLQDIYQQIGKDGIVHWDISKTGKDFYTIGKGITVDGAGFVSPYMADLDEQTGQFKNIARWTRPKILITRQKIVSAGDFNDLFSALNAKDIKEVVVFCDEYEANVVADLVRTRAVRGFKALLVKMPTLWKDWWYEDLAKATGATIIDPNAGISMKMAKIEHLGTCENIVVDKENSYLDGIQDVTEHVKTLEEEGSDDSKLRASRLNTKTARYFVGAGSDSALSYRRLKVEDAISASWQALQNGVVAGGGVTLLQVAQKLPNSLGGIILGKALMSPAKQIVNNIGTDLSFNGMGKDNKGINTKTGELVDMFEAGIIDPANVTLNSVRNALSVASAILTTNVIIQLPRPDITEQLVHSIMSKNQPN